VSAIPPVPTAAWYARLLRYDAWANRETLGSLQSANPPAKALRWLGHIVGSGELWLARLRDEPPSLAVWPDLDLDRCAAGVARLAAEWPRYLSGLAEGDIERSVVYRNSRGEDWSSTVADILTHVAVHGAYHRAQIAAAVRESGGEPAYTDFIHATRQGLIP
jgi:uncharacterized damage-inducible protein DinB